MADNNAPRGRKRTDTVQGQDVHKRGEGLGTGKVGSQSGYQGRPGTSQGQQGPRPGGSSGSQTTRAGGGKGGILAIIAVIAALFIGSRSLFGGGSGLLSGLLGSSLSSGLSMTSTPQAQSVDTSSYASMSSLFSSLGSSANFSAMSSGTSTGSGSSNGWAQAANTGKLDKSVVSGARAKYTTLKGNGQDTVTIMVYMCGTDLESRNGMATADLVEMTKANRSSNAPVTRAVFPRPSILRAQTPAAASSGK